MLFDNPGYMLINGRWRKDLTGKQFGEIGVIGFDDSRYDHGNRYWHCICLVCGSIYSYRESSLLRKTKACQRCSAAGPDKQLIKQLLWWYNLDFDYIMDRLRTMGNTDPEFRDWWDSLPDSPFDGTSKFEYYYNIHEMLERGICELCDQATDSRGVNGLQIDHRKHHWIRGILCTRCNHPLEHWYEAGLVGPKVIAYFLRQEHECLYHWAKDLALPKS